MSETIVCICGRVWTARRFPLTEPCQDFAVCLCGQTLKQWCEAAGYVFEPAGVTFAQGAQANREMPDWPPVGLNAVRGRFSRGR